MLPLVAALAWQLRSCWSTGICSHSTGTVAAIRRSRIVRAVLIWVSSASFIKAAYTATVIYQLFQSAILSLNKFAALAAARPAVSRRESARPRNGRPKRAAMVRRSLQFAGWGPGWSVGGGAWLPGRPAPLTSCGGRRELPAAPATPSFAGTTAPSFSNLRLLWRPRWSFQAGPGSVGLDCAGCRLRRHRLRDAGNTSDLGATLAAIRRSSIKSRPLATPAHQHLTRRNKFALHNDVLA